MRTAAELAVDHLHYLPQDPDRWATLIAEDMTWEFPFAPEGQTNRYVGRAAVTKLVADFVAVVKDLRFSAPLLHPIANEDAVFAEFSGVSTVIANGRKYEQDYAFYMRANAGRVSRIREYINPLKSLKAFS